MIYRCRSDVDGTKTPAIEHLEQAGNQSPPHQFQDSPDQVQERSPPTKQHCLDHRDPSSPIAPSPEPLSPILKERVCGSSTYRCFFCFFLYTDRATVGHLPISAYTLHVTYIAFLLHAGKLVPPKISIYFCAHITVLRHYAAAALLT